MCLLNVLLDVSFLQLNGTYKNLPETVETLPIPPKTLFEAGVIHKNLALELLSIRISCGLHREDLGARLPAHFSEPVHNAGVAVLDALTLSVAGSQSAIKHMNLRGDLRDVQLKSVDTLSRGRRDDICTHIDRGIAGSGTFTKLPLLEAFGEPADLILQSLKLTISVAPSDAHLEETFVHQCAEVVKGPSWQSKSALSVAAGASWAP